MNYHSLFTKAFNFIVKLLGFEALICLGVAVSFLVTGRFSFLAYSERLFWAGIVAVLLGGVIGFGIMFSGRSFGVPAIIRRPSEAKKYLEHFGEIREEVEKRYDASIVMWVIGLVCIAISALVQTLLA